MVLPEKIAFVLGAPAVVVTALLVSVALMLFLAQHGAQLGPDRIMPLEFPWTVEKANKVIQSWTPAQRDIAVAQILWDFLFIVAYTAFLCGFAVWAAQVTGNLNLGAIALWLGILAGCTDILENLLMLHMLGSGPVLFIPLLTSLLAAVKFGAAIGSFLLSLFVLARHLIL